jgi:winged helix-turn helix protein
MYRRTLVLTDAQRAEAVAAHGLLKARHPDTLYDWLNRYQAHGLAGLIHKPRGHRGFSPSRRGGPGGDGAAHPGEHGD